MSKVTQKTGLCIGGGGILGIGEIGALQRWTELGGSLSQLTHVVGSSVGSIIAIAIAAGADMKYIHNKIGNLDYSRFKDGPNTLVKLFRFFKRYGWYEGKAIGDFIGSILQDLVGNSEITMLQLYEKTKKHLTITYTSLNFEDVFYIDHITEPDTKVKEAGHMSGCYPGFYEAYRRRYLHTPDDDPTQSKYMDDIIIDGGTLDNYPLHVLREQGLKDDQIFGLKLYSSQEIEQETKQQSNKRCDSGEPKNAEEYLTRLISLFRKSATKQYVRSSDWLLTVKIDIKDYSSIDFNITDNQKIDIYNAGVKAMDDFAASQNSGN